MSPPFPLRAAIGDAYRDVFGDLRRFLGCAGLWILLPVGLAAAGGVAFGRIELPAEPGLPIIVPLELVAFNILENLALLVGLSAVVVAWHRRLLIGEVGAGALVPAPVTGRVLRYMGVTFFLVMAVALVVLLLSFVLGTLLAGPGGDAGVIAGTPALRIVIGCIVALTMARIHLLLPAIAIDDPDMSFGRSFKLTAGYTIPVLVGLIACAVPITLAGILIQGVFATAGGSFVGRALATVTDFLQAAVIGAFLAFSYRFFTTHIAGHPTIA